jgi:hypothetical protein
MDTTTPATFNALSSKWNLYYHLQNDSNWSLDSYKVVMKDIDTVECVNALNNALPEYLMYNCMFFCMKSGISPMWEDARNRVGGCFSYRVQNADVAQAWKKLMCAMCGQSLSKGVKYESHINGITVSPKSRYSVIKIWMDTCQFQDPDIIQNIPSLSKEGCLFKKHDEQIAKDQRKK